ncbi:hypothetical protein RB213_008263 [Colletotrichum asianum]
MASPTCVMESGHDSDRTAASRTTDWVAAQWYGG